MMHLGGITVVVPTHNGNGLLRACLQSLLVQVAVPSFEIIIVDDASSDDTAAMVLAEFPAAQLVRRTVNAGPGASRNTGWRMARGEIIAYLDHDVTVEATWLGNALRYFEDPSVGGVEGRTEVSNPERITPFTHWTKNLEGGQYPFCNMLLRRSVLEDLDGFDERFYDSKRRVHFREDIEFAFRALDRGWHLIYAPDVVAHHPPLPASYLRPINLAQRYYFDPLLCRLHPARFRRSVETHRLGPLVVRRPRQIAAFANTVSAVGMLIALGRGRWRSVRLLLPFYVVSYAFSIAASVRHNRMIQLPLKDMLAALVIYIAVPWVHVWSYLRGVWVFRRIAPIE